jgi:hypothetical protein
VRFLGVTGGEARAVKPRQTHIVEREARRERGKGPFSVTRGALSFRVTARAEVASGGRARAVLADPVAVVDQMVVGQRAFGLQIDVATAAVAQSPLVAVLVTAEATRHLRQHRFGPLFGHFHVAVNAITRSRPHVLGMRETQVLARELDRIPHVLFSVAGPAWPRIVRLLVAPDALRVCRHVQGHQIVGGLHARVALDAAYPLEHMGTVLEGMGLRRAPDAQHARAARQDDGQGQQPDGQAAAHGSSSARETRTSAFVS